MTIQNLRLRAPVNFPASVQGTGGITVVKSAGSYVVKPDFTQLSSTAPLNVSNPSLKQLWMFDTSTGVYNVLTLTDLNDATHKLTSATSVTVGTGSKTFTDVQLSRDFPVASSVLITSNAAPITNYMIGQVTAYANSSLTVNVTIAVGSGAHTDWTIIPSGPVQTGTLVAAANLSDLVNVTTARTNLGLGGAATLSVGTTAGTVAAGNDSRIKLVGTTAGTIAAGDDSRITSAAQKSNIIVDLRDAMNTHYSLSNTWIGGSRTGIGTGTDISPAITDAVTTIRANGGRGKILVPPGVWLMNSTVNVSGISIEGMGGSQGSIIVFNNSNSIAFQWLGTGGFTGGGMRGITLSLESGLGSTASYGLYMIGTASFQADQMMFEDIYMSSLAGATYWFQGVTIDGTARTSPQGSRVGNITNMQIFQCSNLSFYGSNLVQWSIVNLGSYTGTGNGNDIYITGNGTATTNSIQVTVNRLLCSGSLHLTNCSDLQINGKAVSVTIDTTATYTQGWIHAPSGVIGSSAGTGNSLTVQT